MHTGIPVEIPLGICYYCDFIFNRILPNIFYSKSFFTIRCFENFIIILLYCIVLIFDSKVIPPNF